MAINRETLRLAEGLRIAIGQAVDGVTADLVRAWARTWNDLAYTWQQAVDDLAVAAKDGRWPARTTVLRAERAQAALVATRRALDELAGQADIEISRPLASLVDVAADYQARMVAAQMPPTEQGRLGVTFNRVDRDALDAIVTRSTEQVTSTLKPLSPEAFAAVQSEIVRGVAVGDNPRDAAARMLRRVEGRFAGGLTRAMTIASTEMLDAHRAAGHAQDRANRDVLAGWVWHAELDTRTCPSCWSRHGNQYAVETAGPLDHQRGRCSRTPVTKSWRDLGFDLDEPSSLLPDARATFDALPEVDQVTIMGPKRLELLKAGKATWGDLSKRRMSPEWRTSYGVRPLTDLASASRG